MKNTKLNLCVRLLMLAVVVPLGGCAGTAVTSLNFPEPPAPALAAADAAPGKDKVLRSGDERLLTAGPRDPLPLPSGLLPQVEFWRKVYAVWGLGQAALHDDRYLNLVYEVVALPRPVGDDYNSIQRAFVAGRQRVLYQRLRTLEEKYAAGVALDAAEQRLAGLIIDAAGSDAIAGAAERLRSQRGLRQRFATGLRVSGRYLALFEAIFGHAGLPRDLALLPHVESSFQLLARSSAGAAGMWQFTRPTGRLFLRMNRAIDERLDPVAAARGAARLLKDNYRRLGSWPHALTAYNHGVGGMYRGMQRYGDDFTRLVFEFDGRRFGFASRNFYAQFLAAREVARNHHKYFPGVALDAPLQAVSVVLERPARPAEIGYKYKVSPALLRQLNPAWRRAAWRGLALPRGTEVWLPSRVPAAPGRTRPDPAVADET